MGDTYSIHVKCESRGAGLRSYRAMAVRHQHKGGPVVLYLSEAIVLPKRWGSELTDFVLGHLIDAARRHSQRFAARDEGAEEIDWAPSDEAPAIDGTYARGCRVVSLGHPRIPAAHRFAEAA